MSEGLRGRMGSVVRTLNEAEEAFEDRRGVVAVDDEAEAEARGMVNRAVASRHAVEELTAAAISAHGVLGELAEAVGESEAASDVLGHHFDEGGGAYEARRALEHVAEDVEVPLASPGRPLRGASGEWRKGRVLALISRALNEIEDETDKPDAAFGVSAELRETLSAADERLQAELAGPSGIGWTDEAEAGYRSVMDAEA